MTETKSLTEALAKVQAHLPGIGKNKTAKVPTKTGGSYSYSYADLADIQPVILPLLAAQGLSWVTRPTMGETGFVLAYELTHPSGEQVSGLYPLPDPRTKTAQEIGSAITYARRYTLCCVVGVVPDEDEDGHLATVSHVVEPVPPPSRASVLKIEIAALGDKLGLSRGEVSELWHAERGTSIRDTQDIKALTAFRAELKTRLGEVQQ
jgi:hypothetical protein